MSPAALLADEPPVILRGDANPWNLIPPTPSAEVRGEFATAFFPDPTAPEGILEKRVEVLALWECIGGADVVEVDRQGNRYAGATRRHTLPLDRLTSETTHARKHAAYAARLAAVRPGCCPECWRRGKAIPSATVAACPFVERHVTIRRPEGAK